MRAVPSPRLHLFVCANRREGSPLGPGCADRGEAVYDALKREVAARGLVNPVWVTKTHCLGICPKEGATCARYGVAGEPAVLTDVLPEEAAGILDAALATEASSNGREELWAEVERALAETEELHRTKVLDLARRLKPGLTGEDIQNPHDFPELHDPDWHYADGILTGIQTIASALRAMRRDEDEKGH